MSWQEEVSEEEWGKWVATALRLAKSRNISPTLGADDYAATAIEKLLTRDEKPANIEGWLALTITRLYIDRYRGLVARGGRDLHDLDERQSDNEMILHVLGDPSYLHALQESVSEILAVLTEKEQEILVMSVAGFDNERIARHLHYGSGRIVATRLGQIKKKVKDRALPLGGTPS